MPVPTIAGYNQANNAHVPKVVVDVPVIEDRSVEEHPAAAINNSSNITEVALAKLLVKWVVESEAGAKGNKPVLNGDHHFNMTAADVAKLVVQVEKCPAVKRMMAEERLHG